MNYTQAAEIIKDSVSTAEVAGMLGYKVGRGGFMVCPFHGDHDASLKVYSGRGGHTGWHCFGCNKGGSVIDFVMESEGCNFSRAVRIINDGMGLNLLMVEDMFSHSNRQKIQRKLDDVKNAFDRCIDDMEEHADRIRLLDTKWLMWLEEKPKEDRTADEWTRIQTLTQELQYYEYLNDKISELREEVRLWRNRARSGKSR